MKLVLAKPEDHENEDTLSALLGSQVGIVDISSWDALVEDLRELQQNPYTQIIAIPHDLETVVLPDTITYPSLELHRGLTRLQICLWYYQDNSYDKPIHLIDATTYDEMRLLSGIPSVHSISLINEQFTPRDLVVLAASVGDFELLDRIYPQ